MKKISLTIIILFILIQAFGYFEDFAENPAFIADREFGDIILPAFDLTGGFTNNHLNLSDLGMFEKDHVLTESEKTRLSSADLNFKGYGRLNILSFGYRNWEFSLNDHTTGYLGNLDKEFMSMALYGNTEDQYLQSAGSDSYAYHFIKGKFNWAYPQGLNFAFIPVVRMTDKNSNQFMYALESTLNYMREMNIYIGGNIDFYNANGYAEVLESSQELITSPDSLYYHYEMEMIYTDPEMEEINSGVNWGFGLGVKLELPEGWIHFGMDDIGATLKYDGLVKNYYSGNYSDYLELFNEDYEPEEESESIEEEPYPGGAEVKLSPTVVVGAEYNVLPKLSVMVKTLNCDYSLDGFFLGTTYRPLSWLPLRLTYGAGEIDSYKLDLGFDTESFEFMLGFIDYNGLFNAAKGYGVDFGFRFKF